MLENDNRPVHRRTRSKGPPSFSTGADIVAPTDDLSPSAPIADAVGNSLCLGALAGSEHDGFHQFVAGEMALEAAGIQTESPLSSNAAMMRVLRKAQAGVDSEALDRHLGGGGRPLSPEHLARFNAAFDHDFSHVRIHSDGSAHQAAEAVSAHAFAIGSDIYFGGSEFSPGSPSGDRLLAHELTHVQQYDEGRVPTSSGETTVSSPSDPLEREAYANEDVILGELAAQNQAGMSLSADQLQGYAESTHGEFTPAIDARFASTHGESSAIEQNTSDTETSSTPASASSEGEILRDGPPAPAAESAEAEAPQTSFDVQAAVDAAVAPLAEVHESAPETAPPEASEAPETSSEPASTEAPTTSAAAPAAPTTTAGGLELASPEATYEAIQTGAAPTVAAPSASTASEVPQVQEAFAAYLAVATAHTETLNTDGAAYVERVNTAITSAETEISVRATQMRDDLDARLRTVGESVDTSVEAARTALDGFLATRKQELVTQHAAVLTALDAAAVTHRGTLDTAYSTRANLAVEDGRRLSEDVGSEATRLAGEATACGDQQATYWANEANWEGVDEDYSASLATDVGRYAKNTAKKVADEITKAGTDAKTAILADGQELGEDLDSNGRDLVEAYDEKVQEIKDTFNDDLETANTQLDDANTNGKQALGDQGDQIKEDLAKEGEGLHQQINDLETSQMTALQTAGTTAHQAITDALESSGAGLTDQIAQVQAMVDSADPTQWPLVVQALEQLTADLTLAAGDHSALLESIVSQLESSFGETGTSATGQMDQSWSQMEQGLTALETTINTQLQQSAAAIDSNPETGFAKIVSGNVEAWNTKRTENEALLEKSATDGEAELESEYQEGKTNLEEKATEAKTKMAEPVTELKQELPEDCHFKAESPILAMGTAFLGGVWEAVKGFLVCLAVVVAVIVVIAAIILVCCGWEVLLAVGAAVLGFIATWAAVIEAIGAFLTVVGLIIAFISMMAVLLNPDSSRWEWSSAIGEFAGNLLTEWLEGVLGNATKVAEVAEAGDAVSDTSRAVSSAADATNAGDLAQAGHSLEQASEAAGAVPEIAEVAAPAADAAQAAEQAAEAATEAQHAAEAVDAVGDVGHATEGAGSAAGAATAAAAGDATHAAENVGEATQSANAVGDATHTAENVGETAQSTEAAAQASHSADAAAEATQAADAAATATKSWDDPSMSASEAWAIYKVEAPNGSMTWNQFQAKYATGLRFNPANNRWMRPTAQAAEAVADTTHAADATADATQAADAAADTTHAAESTAQAASTTPTTSPEAPTTSPEAPSTSPEAPATSPDAPTTRPYTYEGEDKFEGAWAVFWASWNVIEGLAVTFWQGANGGKSPWHIPEDPWGIVEWTGLNDEAGGAQGLVRDGEEHLNNVDRTLSGEGNWTTE